MELWQSLEDQKELVQNKTDKSTLYFTDTSSYILGHTSKEANR